MRPGDYGGIVGARIVANNNLIERLSLRRRGSKQARQERGGIVCRNAESDRGPSNQFVLPKTLLTHRRAT